MNFDNLTYFSVINCSLESLFNFVQQINDIGICVQLALKFLELYDPSNNNPNDYFYRFKIAYNRRNQLINNNSAD